jgi:hypothetical protein
MSKPKYLVGLNCILLGNQLKAKGISNANIVNAHRLVLSQSDNVG